MCCATEERVSCADGLTVYSPRGRGSHENDAAIDLVGAPPGAKLELTHAACERSDSRKQNALHLQGVSFSPQRQIAPR